MDLLAIFKALKARSFPFQVLQAELNLRNMDSAAGWDRLLEKYETNSSIPQNLFDGDSAIYFKFKELYLNHLYFGTKAVIIFSIEENVALNLIDKFSKLDYRSSPFQSKYPFPLNESELEDLSPNPIPTHCDNENIFRVIYCSRRIFKVRETIDFANLDSFDRNALSEYDSIFGIRSVLFQSFDNIIIRPIENRLEIHIDISQPCNASNFLSANDISKTIKFYIGKINELLKDADITLNSPMNFFPRIPLLYEEKDGYVHQLGHATGTASIKDERMRKKTLDLREELFHGKGLEAIGQWH
jgi:hypothetical protein